MDYTDNTEPPQMYHLWTGISTVAAALQRKCFLDWGHLRIFPNLYVILVGPPGGRKGTAMKIGKRLLTKHLQVKLAAEYTTRAALIQALEESADTVEYYHPPEGKALTLMHCSLTIFSEELAVFLGDKNPEMIMTMTDLFDCPGQWRYRTKHVGTNEITNAWLNLCGAITPTLLQAVLSADAVGGGLTSRMIFVVEKGKAKKIALPFLTDAQCAMESQLAADLHRIHSLSGRFCMDEEAIATYANWYENSSPVHPGVMALEGYNERKALHLLKLCMVLSACRSDSLTINLEDMQLGLEILEKTEINMAAAYHGFGRSQDAAVLGELITYLSKSGKVPFTRILDRFKFDVDKPKLINMLTTLVEMGKIRADADKGKPVYKWIG